MCRDRAAVGAAARAGELAGLCWLGWTSVTPVTVLAGLCWLGWTWVYVYRAVVHPMGVCFLGSVDELKGKEEKKGRRCGI